MAFITDTSAALLSMAAVNEHLKRIVSYLRSAELLHCELSFFWSFELCVRILFQEDFCYIGSQTVLFLLMLNSSFWFFRLSVDVDVTGGVDIS